MNAHHYFYLQTFRVLALLSLILGHSAQALTDPTELVAYCPRADEAKAASQNSLDANERLQAMQKLYQIILEVDEKLENLPAKANPPVCLKRFHEAFLTHVNRYPPTLAQQADLSYLFVILDYFDHLGETDKSDQWLNEGLKRYPQRFDLRLRAFQRAQQKTKAYNPEPTAFALLKRSYHDLMELRGSDVRIKDQSRAAQSMAELFDSQGATLDALNAWRTVLALDPRHDQARMILAQRYLSLKRDADALPLLSELSLRTNPTPTSAVNYVRLLQKNSQHSLALDYLRSRPQLTQGSSAKAYELSALYLEALLHQKLLNAESAKLVQKLSQNSSVRAARASVLSRYWSAVGEQHEKNAQISSALAAYVKSIQHSRNSFSAYARAIAILSTSSFEADQRKAAELSRQWLQNDSQFILRPESSEAMMALSQNKTYRKELSAACKTFEHSGRRPASEVTNLCAKIALGL